MKELPVVEVAVPRPARSEAQVLLQEARAIEMLADETEVSPDRLQDYWALAADLITLVTDIEQHAEEHPNADFEDPEILALRRRLREIASRLAEIGME
jgi:hypothetical protein